MFSTQERLIAYHEIGHALACECVSIDFTFVTANREDRAVTRSDAGAKAMARNPFKKLVVALCGPAAESAMAEKLVPDFDFDAFVDHSSAIGWSSDLRQATEAVPKLESRFRPLIRHLSDLVTKPVAEFGEDLVPRLLSFGTSMPAEEVRGFFRKHEDSVTELAKHLNDLLARLKHGNRRFLD